MKKFLEFYNEKKRACKEFFEGHQKSKKAKNSVLTKEKDSKSKKNVLLVDQEYSIDLSDIINQKKIKKRFVNFKLNLKSEIDVKACVVENDKTIMNIENHDTVTISVNREKNVELKITPKIESSEIGDIDLGLRVGKSKINYSLTAYKFDFIADLNKNETVKNLEKEAVFLNCDDKADSLKNDLPAKSLGEVNIRKFGPANYPENFKLILELNESDSDKIKLFSQEDINEQSVIGEGKRWVNIEENMFNNNVLRLYAQALEHQDKKFDGFIDLKLNFASNIQMHNQKMLKPIYANEKMNPSILNITFFVEPEKEAPKVQVSDKKSTPDSSTLSLVKQAEQIVKKVCVTENEAVPGYLNRRDIRIQDKTQKRIARNRRDQRRRANLDMAFEIPREMGLAILPSYGQHLSNFSYNLHSRSSSKRLPGLSREKTHAHVSHFNKYSSIVR